MKMRFLMISSYSIRDITSTPISSENKANYQHEDVITLTLISVGIRFMQVTYLILVENLLLTSFTVKNQERLESIILSKTEMHIHRTAVRNITDNFGALSLKESV